MLAGVANNIHLRISLSLLFVMRVRIKYSIHLCWCVCVCAWMCLLSTFFNTSRGEWNLATKRIFQIVVVIADTQSICRARTKQLLLFLSTKIYSWPLPPKRGRSIQCALLKKVRLDFWHSCIRFRKIRHFFHEYLGELDFRRPIFAKRTLWISEEHIIFKCSPLYLICTVDLIGSFLLTHHHNYSCGDRRRDLCRQIYSI